MNKLQFWCIKSTSVVFSKFWNYFLCVTNPTICTSNIFELLDGPWPDIKVHYFMHCHNLTESSFSLDHLCRVHGSSFTWWPCLLIPFLFFAGTCSTFLGMCACIQLSLVGFLFISSRHLCDMSWSGILGDDSFVLTHFYFDWKIPCTVYVLWWDYSQMTVVVITIKCGVRHSFQRHQFL